MNICVAGKNNIAVDVVSYLNEHNNGRYKLCTICNDSRKELIGFQKSLSSYAKQYNIPIVKLEETYCMKDLIFLSMEFDKIIKPNLFSDARLFNIHFSLLPAYKGMYTSAIPILNGERFTGVTFHRIDSGIDTGEIISQRKIPIGDKDTARDLYIKYNIEGARLVIDNIESVIDGREKSHKQSNNGASYYPKGYIDYANLKININTSAQQVERQIRAFSFREYQMPCFNGVPVCICEISEDISREKAGTVLYEDQSKICVTTIDYNVILYKDRFEELIIACENGDIDNVKEICSVGINIINSQNSFGWTPLIVATYNNNVKVVEYLISVGADINITNYNGTNLLMYAKEAYIRTGDRTLFDLLVKKGLNCSKKDLYGKNVIDYIKEQGVNELLLPHYQYNYMQSEKE